MIGILDSGLAGLDLTRRLLAGLPRHRFIYFGDTAHGPYDEKSPEAVLRRTLRAGAVSCGKWRPENRPGLPRDIGRGGGSPGGAIGGAGDRCGGSCGGGGRPGFPAREDRRHGDPGRRSAPAPTWTGSGCLRPRPPYCQASCPLIGALIAEGWLKKPETTRIVKKSPDPPQGPEDRYPDSGRRPLSGSRGRHPEKNRHAGSPGRAVGRSHRPPQDDPAPPPGNPEEARAEFYLSDIPPETERRAAVFMKRRVRFRPAAS